MSLRQQSSTLGNQPHILKIITSHKRALSAVLSSGLARHHRANPASSIRIEKLYGIPVLLSGVASLTLLQSEKDTLVPHYKTNLKSLLKIRQKTQWSFVFIMAGSLPLQAILDLRMLGLFSMISRLPNYIVNKHARQLLITVQDNSRSWLIQVKNICVKYQLLHPLTLLESPLPKDQFKLLAKKHVQLHWEGIFRDEASPPESLALSSPHPLITSCGSSS